MTAPQILARSKIGSFAAYCGAAPCLTNRNDAAGLKFGAKIHRILGEEKTDSSICLSIIPKRQSHSLYTTKKTKLDQKHISLVLGKLRYTIIADNLIR